MNAAHVRFKVGSFNCIALRDGEFNYPVASFFAGVPLERVQAELKLRGLPATHIATPYTCLYVDTGRHQVMIDAGAGSLSREARQLFPDIDHTTTQTGLVQKSLMDAGVSPADVDTVIITHAHPDHVGGTLDASGKLVFPNAKYYISRDEHDYWYNDSNLERATHMMREMIHIARMNLDALGDQLSILEGDVEVVPGMDAINTPGHTPGHIALSIKSDDAQLIHVSDAVLHPLHLEQPDWVPVFDISPLHAAQSKQRIFDKAAGEHAMVFAHHFPPFPNLGYVQKQPVGWLWQPVDVSSL
jgi:glyoxylase-like metal-dependent hydrolase (beta-lactamase superfamily II)